MSDIKKVKNNLVFSGFAALTNIFLFLTLLAAARFYGVVNYGILSFGLSCSALFGFIFGYGFMQLSIREIAKDKSLAAKYAGNITIMKCALKILSFVLLIIFLNLFDYPFEVRIVVYILSFAAFFRSFSFTFRYLYRAFEMFQLETLTLGLERAFILLAGLLVIYLKLSIVYFALAFLAVRILGAIFTFITTNKNITKMSLNFDYSFSRNIMIVAFPFAITTFLFSIYSSIDTVMISLIKNQAQVGLYNAAYRIFEGLIFLPAIIADAFYPRFSIQNKVSKKAVIDLYKRASKYICVISLPITASAIVLGHKVISFIYGVEYLDSVLIMKILFVAFFFLSVARLYNTMLNSIDRQKESAYLFAGTVVINIIVNVLLIPKYGATGAAFATVFSESVYFVSSHCLLLRYGYRNSLFRISIRPVAATLIMTGFFLLTVEINLIFQLVCGGIIYFAALFFLGTWDKDERSLLTRFLRTEG